MSWEETVVRWGAEAMRLWDAYMAVPGVKPAYEILLFLISISGSFWLLSRLFGWVALKIHDSLDRSLAVLFAVVYNIVLALLFSSVLYLGIMAEKGDTRSFMLYQVCGFVYVYILLGAVYADRRTGEIDEYGILGFIGGLVSYLAFAVHPALLGNRPTVLAYEALQAMKEGWVGRVVSAYFLYASLRYCAGLGWKGLLLLLAPFARVHRRFFFETPSRHSMILGECT